MKALGILILLILVALSSACATLSEPGKGVGKIEPDLSHAYILAVEREAQEQAMTIYWVNPPTAEQVARMIDKDSGS